jgi:chromosome transmission fidelity protein 18
VGLSHGAVSRAGWQYLRVLTCPRPVDELAMFATSTLANSASSTPTRYAICQVLDQELHKAILVQENAARQARYHAGGRTGEEGAADGLANAKSMVHPATRSPKLDKAGEEERARRTKRDFFGRPIADQEIDQVRGKHPDGHIETGGPGMRARAHDGTSGNVVWVTFHEGFSNAVRKPVTVQEILLGL